jgi:hypothetical protein
MAKLKKKFPPFLYLFYLYNLLFYTLIPHTDLATFYINIPFPISLSYILEA